MTDSFAPDAIRRIVVGSLETNCYVVVRDGKCMVVDPGADGAQIARILDEQGLQVALIVATHGHHDHVGGVSALKRATGAPFAISERDAWRCTQALELSSHAFDVRSSGLENAPEPDRVLTDGDVVEVADCAFSVLETPGHTEGSIVLKGEGVCLTGDTVFAGSVGRCDLLGGDMQAMRRSVARLKQEIDPKTLLLCGHGPETTMEHELRWNPYFV